MAKDKEIVAQQQAEYTAKNIQKLDPREHVRRRPGMYVGGTDARALHHLIYEVVDNSIDEALAGRCDRIVVTLHDNRGVTIAGQRYRHSSRYARLREARARGSHDGSRRRR